MHGLLILIYLHLGYQWVNGQLHLGLSWPKFFANLLVWPLFLLISMVSCLQVKPDNVIRGES